MRPGFITFEGLDGSGKSTHLDRAASWLRSAGTDVITTREPGGTPLGKALRTIFLSPEWSGVDGGVEALLVFAARRQHLLEVIEPAYAAGRLVLCDRFTDSTFAYQGFARGFPLGRLRELDQASTGGRRPDLTLLFDLPAATARRRRGAGKVGQGVEVDRLDLEDLDFYDRVRRGFLQLADEEPERFRIIDSSGDLEATENQVRSVLAGALQ